MQLVSVGSGVAAGSVRTVASRGAVFVVVMTVGFPWLSPSMDSCAPSDPPPSWRWKPGRLHVVSSPWGHGLETAPLARLRRADLLIVAMEPGPPRAVQGLHRGGVLPDRISIATTPFRDASFRSRASERVASLVGPLEAAPPGAPACVAMGPFAGQSAGTEGQGRSCCCRLRSVISGHPRCRRHPVGCVTHSGFAVALTAAFTVTASVPGQAADGRKAAACSRLCRGCRRGHSDWP